MRYSLVNTRTKYVEEEPPTARMPRVVMVGRRLLAIMSSLTEAQCEELLSRCREWAEDMTAPQVTATVLVDEAELCEAVTHIKLDI